MTRSSEPSGAASPRRILGLRVDPTSYREAADLVIAMVRGGTPGYLCAANVHMVMEAFDDHRFREAVNGATLVTPDGMPLVWGLRALGCQSAQRVYGPTLTLHVCAAAAEAGIPIALYGGTDESLAAFSAFLRGRFPGLAVVLSIAPPFRPLSAEEDLAYTRDIVASGAGILLVGIGCPKQEWWMARHASSIPAVLLGVGAAFDFHSGRVRQAPPLVQRAGLEWLFRLLMEPRRLWKRYLKHNPRFLWLFARQLIRGRLGLDEPSP